VNVQVQRSKPATVVVDTMRVEMSSSAKTVEGLLEDLGMTVREGDLVRPSLDTPVTAGMVVKLAKARTITVVLDGQEQSLYTQAATVGDVVRVLGLTLGPEDAVSLPADTLVQNGMSLSIARTIIKDEDVQASIPPPTVNDTDPSLAAGTVQVVPGVEGVQTTHYRVTYKNGVEAKRDLLSTEVTQQPVATRRVVGTKPAPSAPRPTLNAPGYNGPFKKTVVSHVTWYNASQGAWDRSDPNYGRTASGATVDYGICATDPNVIPMGTHMYIPGYGNCVAADTGGAIKGNDIDLGFPESAGNSPWATQDLEIYILD
jgi:3D (Asp-Asp-Asp) domain-containing protein